MTFIISTNIGSENFGVLFYKTFGSSFQSERNNGYNLMYGSYFSRVFDDYEQKTDFIVGKNGYVIYCHLGYSKQDTSLTANR